MDGHAMIKIKLKLVQSNSCPVLIGSGLNVFYWRELQKVKKPSWLTYNVFLIQIILSLCIQKATSFLC